MAEESPRCFKVRRFDASAMALCFNLDIVIVPLVPTGIATPTGLRTGICIVCRFFIRSLKEDFGGMALWTLGGPVGILRFFRLWRQVLIEHFPRAPQVKVANFHVHFAFEAWLECICILKIVRSQARRNIGGFKNKLYPPSAERHAPRVPWINPRHAVWQSFPVHPAPAVEL